MHMGHTFRKAVCLALAFVGLTQSAWVCAQGSLSSGVDPLEMFRSLTPDEQQMIMRQLGIGGGGAGGALGGFGGQAGYGELGNNQAQELMSQRARQAQQQQQELEERLPIFRPQDWVVVEVDIHPLPPRMNSSTSLYQALTAGNGGQSSLLGSSGAQLNGPAQLAGVASSQLSPQQLQALMQYQQQQDQQVQSTPPSPSQPADPQLAAQQSERRGHFMDLIRSKNPYQLTREGVLNLPGFAGIRLAGLTEAQATLRLDVEPALSGLYFRLTRLPLTKAGPEGLKPFGYDLFDRSPSTFAPETNVPVPADYVVGPGDELDVQLYGSQNRSFILVVQRDGRVNFPELGPIGVGGQHFTSVKENLESRVARQMMGVKASVSMDQTRAIQVFVLGEANYPGSYTVSGLGTITSALYASGGIKPIGSLRDVQLKRAGTIVRHLDLYDLLLHGNTSADARLQPGDVVFIPPVGETVGIDGEVHRPAIYEIKRSADAADLVELAGGLTADAEPNEVMLTRIDDHAQRVVLHVNLESSAGREVGLRNGDMLIVFRLRPTLDFGVLLQGYVYNPGAVAFRPGMRLTDVIHSVDDVKMNADLHYVLIRRELLPDRRIVVFSADLQAALAARGSAADIPLQARDQIMVFDLQSGRDRIIQPLLDELRLQSRLDRPSEVVRAEGQVNVPGQYPLEPGMRISDLVRAGGGLSDAAYGQHAELTRYTVVNGETRQTELIPVNLLAALRGDAQANLVLMPFDSLTVKQVSEWSDQEQVTLRGQVRFPGVYTIKNGDTLKSVLMRAGGLTQFAFPEGSVFTRVELKRREQDQLDLLAQRTQTDVAAMALQAVAGGALTGGGGGGAAAGASALSVGQTLLNQLKAAKAVGRLVIDVPRLMAEPEGSPEDVVLRNGDELIVPRYQQEVTVIGEVQSVTSHLYRPELTRDDYISMSGGMTNRADSKKIYVVRANGSVSAAGGHFFRAGGEGIKMHAGDTVVVPLNTEKLPPLAEWQAITAIIYNLAIGAAAVHALGL